MRSAAVLPGRPFPLGASWDGDGVNFAVFSEHAERIELCLIASPAAKRDARRIELPDRTDHIWHGYLPGAAPGQLYGFRAYGRYDPLHGFRFNPNKLLLDPYTKAVIRPLLWHDSLFGYNVHDRAQADLSFNTKDSAAHAPLGAVTDDSFDWTGDHRPATPWEKTVIYETHVKGSTRNHPKVPPALRGTYLGLACDPILKHFQSLGVTAVELLPVHCAADDGHLVERGMCNYWGYNTLSFFAPDPRFSSDGHGLGTAAEFKQMVRALHNAGIEVILDVVYNHTCEGNERGPTLSLRGLDNTSYYRLPWENPRYYTDFTGCGNTLSVKHPAVLRLVMDSLRYWVGEMHVDGFRFDLASALARETNGYEKFSSFLNAVQQDPVLSQVKLIAEPWDACEGGYQVGNFPVPWREWNDRYRDAMRSFWRGDRGLLGRTATALSGSSDLYQFACRAATTSINYITSHDGFTLRDLVSYNHKHNKTNCEDNKDGPDNNLSWNCGAEGPSSQARVKKLRLQQRKNFLASLFLSIGVPMLLGGDELGRSQRGNNNAYCLDDRTSWYNWHLDEEDRELLSFTQFLGRIRQEHPVLQRSSFFTGLSDAVSGMKDVGWFSAEGRELADAQWLDHQHNSLGVLFAGPAGAASLFFVLNPSSRDAHFLLPYPLMGSRLELLFDTALVPSMQLKKVSRLRRGYDIRAHSAVLFKKSEDDGPAAS